MKLCPKCNEECDNFAVTCVKCGYNFFTTKKEEPEETKLNLPPAVNVLKQIASSPLFLVAIIAFSLDILFSILGGNGLMAFYILAQSLYSMANNFGMYQLYDVASNIMSFAALPLAKGISMAISLICHIPAIVIAVGLWLTYKSASDKKSPYVDATGLNTIKVVNILYLVWNCVAYVIIGLLLIVPAVALIAEGGEVAILGIYVAAIFIIGALVAAAIIVFYFKINRSLSAVISVAKTGRPNTYASSFVMIFLVFKAVIGVFGFFEVGSFATSVSNLLYVVALVCFAFVLYQYKNQMRAVLAQPQQPMAAPSVPVEEPAIEPVPTPTETPVEETEEESEIIETVAEETVEQPSNAVAEAEEAASAIPAEKPEDVTKTEKTDE